MSTASVDGGGWPTRTPVAEPFAMRLHASLVAGDGDLARAAGEPGFELPTVRLRALPQWQPGPVTDPHQVVHARVEPTGAIQERLAVEFAPDAQDEFDYQPTAAEELPDAEDTVRRVMLGTLEVMSGLRPPVQITRWYAPAIAQRITQRGVVARRRGVRPSHAPRILKVRACRLQPHVIEASVVMAHEGRVRAAALRLIGVDGRWLVTALEMA